MMQHVATVKSEVAAFATGADSVSFKGSESNEQFGKLLQVQKSLHTSVGVSEASTYHSSKKQTLQQSTDERQKVASSAVKQDTTHTDDVQASSSLQAKTSMQSGSEGNIPESPDAAANVESKRDTKNINDELKDGNTTQASQSVSSSKKNDSESASFAAQEWVSLVDDLQKLAEIARSAKQSLADFDVESIDISVSDLILPNKVDKALLDQVNNLQSSGNVNASSDNVGQGQGQGQASYADEERASSLAKEQDQTNLAIYIHTALEQLTSEAEAEQGSSRNILQKTAESLLEQPIVLQDLINHVQIAGQQNSADPKDQSRKTGIDHVIGKELLSASQDVETGEHTDLTLVENQALLRTLLVDSETDKTLAQETTDLESSALPDELESISKPTMLLEQDTQKPQIVTSNILNSSKTEKVADNNNIQNILNLSDSKLDKVLENIAQRVFGSKRTGESISPEQIAQQIVIPKASEITSSVESSSKEFISALKSGIEEFKHQLSQGREPGIDLKALVSDALVKTTDSGAGAKASISLEQMVKSVSQVLDFAQTMSRAIEQHHDQVYSATIRDAAQIQGEQSKQIQLNQFESKFEKAINIAKPEGHLQLAEKVKWMVNTKNLVAEIRLDPAELGSVHVKVAVSGESATVNFVVQSQQARDAVDTATPRLKEMLAEKGIELGQSSVRQESDDQQSQGDATKQGRPGNDESEDIDVSEQVLAQHNIVNGALGGIDYFV